jgi:DNA helicase-2/ATP-dependent DNA helicase PcrA
MVGPDLSAAGRGAGVEDAGLDLDLVLAFGARRTTRFGMPVRPPSGVPAYRQGSGRPGAPTPGESFRPARDLAAKRDAFAGGARSGMLAPEPPAASTAAAPGTVPARPVVPGERRYRDGDRVRHARWGDGIVVMSKLTRSDEEVTVAFKDPSVGRKTVLGSLANLEVIG